jgi:hypothetical protein
MADELTMHIVYSLKELGHDGAHQLGRDHRPTVFV